MACRTLAELCFEAHPDHLAVLDGGGRIVRVNAAWRRFAAENHLGLPDAGLGTSYLAACDLAHGDRSAEAAEVARRLRSLLCGSDQPVTITYPCFGPDTPRWFVLKMTPIEAEGRRWVLVAHQNVTDLVMARTTLVG